MDIKKTRITYIFSLLLILILALGPLVQNAAPVFADGDNFVTSVTYKSNGTELQPNDDGSYTVELGKDYEVDLEFRETKGNQFPADGFTYQLPSGINPVATKGDLSIEFSIVEDGNVVKKTLSGNHYTIASDGTVTVTWNTNDSDVYSAFEDSGNVGFTLKFSASFDGTSTELTFSDTVKTIIKVDDSTNVIVNKSGQYNPETNKVEYTATVIGKKGTSTNVVVKDALTGTALSLDTDSIEISKTPDTAAYPTQKSVSEDGFTYDIPTVNAGDVYTFTYTASVDVSEITGSGTAEETENDIFIKSDENPDLDTAKTDLQDKIEYTDISKSVEIESENDNEVLIKWTIKYGDKDSAASLGGTTLTDKLEWKSSRIRYDTTNHTGITVQENDGTPYTVPWSDVGVTTGNEDNWSWTIPENAAGNTEYTITYYTVYDKSGMVHSEYPINNISDGHGHSARKGISIGSDDVSVVKELTSLDFNSLTAGWTIKITVPASGLKSAYLNDYYPSKTIEGKKYYDTLQDGSVTVSGLLDGETYTIAYSTDHFRIDFSSDYSEDGTTYYDLKPSSLGTRTISVTLKTNINKDWIKAANASEEINDRYHANNAGFHVGKQNVTSADRYYVNPSAISKTVNNNGDPAGYYKSPYSSKGNYSKTLSSDTDLPVWKFRLTLKGVNGDIAIADKFDTDLFEIVPTSVEKDDNRCVTGKSWKNNATYKTDVTGNISKVTVTPTSDGATLYISQENLPKYNNNSGLYYPTYYIDYYLRVKSPEALQKLRSLCAEQGDALKATLTNEVTYDDKTDTENFYYTYEGVKKEITNKGYKDQDGFTYADFKIVLNPTGADLDADSDTIEASDTWSESLAVKPESFVFKDASGNDISDKVSYDIMGHTANFKIPDATAVTVTYRARVLGTGTVNYSNTASMKGYISGASSTAAVASSGQGSGSIFTIYLLKHAEGNINQPLSGAVFSLYELDDSGNKVPVTDKNGSTVTFTTDENGEATLFGSMTNDGWTFYENTQYYLREETAPAGFSRLSEDYAFKVSQNSQDWDDHLYINGDTILISDEKITDLSFTKIWDDSNDIDGLRPSSDEDSDDYFGKWLHLYQTVDGTTTEVTGYTPTITVDENNSSKWKVSYKDLPSIDGTYSVKEVIPDGIDYTADYGSNDETSVSSGGTLTNTHEHEQESVAESFSFTKKWVDVNGGNRPDKDTFVNWLHLYKTVDGTTTEVTGYTPTVTSDKNDSSKWTVTYKDLPSIDGTYSVKEVIPEDADYTADYGAQDKTSVTSGGILTNTYEQETVTESLSFTKKWIDGKGKSRPDIDTFRKWLHLYKTVDGKTTEVKGYTPTITVDENNSRWKVSYKDLPSIDGHYSVKEVMPKGSGYTADYGAKGRKSVTSGGTLTNTNKNKTYTDDNSRTDNNKRKKEKENNTDSGRTDNKQVNSPRTGDNGDIMGYMILLVTAAAAVIVIIAKRRGNKER